MYRSLARCAGGCGASPSYHAARPGRIPPPLPFPTRDGGLVSPRTLCTLTGLRPFSIQAVLVVAGIRTQWVNGHPLIHSGQFLAALGWQDRSAIPRRSVAAKCARKAPYKGLKPLVFGCERGPMRLANGRGRAGCEPMRPPDVIGRNRWNGPARIRPTPFTGRESPS